MTKKTPIEKLLLKASEYQTSNNLQKAENICHKILQINPREADALNILGLIYFSNKKLTEAVNFYLSAIEYKPEQAYFHYNLGNAYTEMEQLNEALEQFKKASILNPSNESPLKRIAVLFWKVGRLQEAEQMLLSTMNGQIKDTSYYVTLGSIYESQGKRHQAENAFKQGLAINPDNPQLHLNLAVIQLSQNNFSDGWENYSWRFSLQSCLSIDRPSWNGRSIKTKNLLIYQEQGIGDDIMFAQFLPEMATLTHTCYVMCDPRLVPLYTRSFPGITVLPSINPDKIKIFIAQKSIDFASPVGELARFLRPDISSFSKPECYLKPDLQTAKKWTQRYQTLGKGLKIGISWQGGITHESFKARSIELEQWLNLLNLPNCHFINLQYGDHSEEIQHLKDQHNITLHHWQDSNPLKDMDDFAAQISALDLVISVDNSTVHLAAALGIATWLLLPNLPEWRWGIRKQSSYWYASITLFHQRIAKQWTAVFTEVIERLNNIQSNHIYRPYLSFTNLPKTILIDPCDTTDDITTTCINNVLTQMLNNRLLNVQNITNNDLSNCNISTHNPEQVFNPALLENFYQDNQSLFQQIEQSSYVIINADCLLGNSHHDALRLMTIAYLTKSRCKKPIYLTNLSICQKTPEQSPVPNAIYQQLFNQLDGISTQDNISTSFLSHANIPHTICFSLIPWYIKNNFSLPSIEKNNSIALSNIHLFNNNQQTTLVDYIKLMGNHGFIVKLLIDINTAPIKQNSVLLQSLPSNTEKNWDFIYIHDANTWLDVLSQTKLLISNKGTDLIAACYLNTPCIPLDNSIKNTDLTRFLEIPSALELATNQIAEQLLQKTLEIVKNPKQYLPSKSHLEALSLSAANALDF